MIGGILRDLKYVARVLGRSRVFTAVAIASLAIGIGANTSIYSVIRVLLFDPMPVRSPDELALVYWHDGGGTTRISNISSSGHTDPATGRSYRSNYSYPLYAAIRDLADDDIDIAGFNFVRGLGVSFDDRPAVLAGGLMADGRYFSVLQPGMALGRALDAADDTLAEPMAVVISHGFWMRAFGGEASTVGRAIRVNGVPALVVGVTARGFRGLSKGGFFPQTDVTLPLRSLPRIMPRWQPEGGSLLTSERHFWVRLLARIAPAAQHGPLEARLSA
ncbi:MAG TPA: ABC transporter permease, partial [Vicinamibacterales bacterium]|nr:ABC transporter permease [Vicinamibacterales bacterium]